MKRSRIKRKPKVRTPEARAYARWISTLPCINCGRQDQESQPAPITLSADQKGTGMKVPDDQQVPLCLWCHGYWDGRIDGPHNPFKGMSRDERYELGRYWVEQTRDRWVARVVAEQEMPF